MSLINCLTRMLDLAEEPRHPGMGCKCPKHCISCYLNCPCLKSVFSTSPSFHLCLIKKAQEAIQKQFKHVIAIFRPQVLRTKKPDLNKRGKLKEYWEIVETYILVVSLTSIYVNRISNIFNSWNPRNFIPTQRVFVLTSKIDDFIKSATKF